MRWKNWYALMKSIIIYHKNITNLWYLDFSIDELPSDVLENPLCLLIVPYFLSFIISLFATLRGRLKVRKQMAVSSSSLEVYIDQQMRTHTSNCNSSRSDANSPPDPGLPQAFSCTAHNQSRVASLPVDLNEKSKLWSSFHILMPYV